MSLSYWLKNEFFSQYDKLIYKLKIPELQINGLTPKTANLFNASPNQRNTISSERSSAKVAGRAMGCYHAGLSLDRHSL
jgi:hypothetical protein